MEATTAKVRLQRSHALTTRTNGLSDCRSHGCPSLNTPPGSIVVAHSLTGTRCKSVLVRNRCHVGEKGTKCPSSLWVSELRDPAFRTDSGPRAGVLTSRGGADS